MSGGAFDVEVRAVECSGCGAPLTVPFGGGTVSCEFCGATNVVSVRPREQHEAPASAADDVARMARLATQKQAAVADNPFDLRVPPEGVTNHDGLETLRAAYERAKARTDLSRLKGAQRDLCWLATHLARCHLEAGEPLRARAVLETSLDLLPDPGHRHILRCRLARLACRDGELDAAAGWLAECDPAPEVLALDTELRLAQAELDLRRGEPAVALERIGDQAGRVPMSPPLEEGAVPLRIAALAQSERGDEARDAVLNLAYANRRVLDGLRATGLAPALVEEQEALESRVEQRLRLLGPLSWLFTAVAVGFTVWVLSELEGALADMSFVGLLWAAAMLPLSWGMALGIGATRREGGVWWPAPIVAALAMVPVGGLITLFILGLAATTGLATNRAPYAARAERPFYAGLFTLGVLVLVVAGWTAE